MIAGHRTLCPRCDELIQPGEQIRCDAQAGGWVHDVCPEATEPALDREALAHPRCTRCGLNHPGEC